MTLQEIIKNSSEGLASFPVLEVGCKELGLSLPEFCDAFAIQVARSYHKGELDWDDGDGAMNSLFYSFVYTNDQADFPKIAYEVFSAFDDGEYQHKGDPVGFDPKLHTQSQIEALISRIGA